MTKLQNIKRDFSLDILKGLGCLLMVVAHSNLGLRGYGPYAFYAGLAPGLFYAVSGVTASFQARKYRPKSVLITYAFLFLLGFSYNRITDAGFLEEINFDIIQIIAVGASIVYLLEKYFKPSSWIYLLLAGLGFALKFPLAALTGGEIVYGVTGIIVAPGLFPIFPWIFLFFLGVFAYRTKNFYNLFFALIAGGLFYFLPIWGIDLDIDNKWDMSVGYFLLNCILVFSCYFLVRLIPLFQQRKGMGLPIFLGRYSLLFLYIHFPLVLFLKSQKLHHKNYLINQNPYLFWILILTVTVLIMLFILLMAKMKWLGSIFDHLMVWVVIIILTFAVGLFIKNVEYVYWIEIGLGVIFATFYPSLTRFLKKPLDPPVAQA